MGAELESAPSRRTPVQRQPNNLPIVRAVRRIRLSTALAARNSTLPGSEGGSGKFCSTTGAQVVLHSMAPRISLPGCRVYARTVSLTRGQQVEVEVAGDGSSDLDLLVIDPTGIAVAVDMTELDTFVTRFWAQTSGSYELRIINQGHRANRFLLTVQQLERRPRWWQRWLAGSVHHRRLAVEPSSCSAARAQQKPSQLANLQTPPLHLLRLIKWVIIHHQPDESDGGLAQVAVPQRLRGGPLSAHGDAPVEAADLRRDLRRGAAEQNRWQGAILAEGEIVRAVR